MKKIVLIAAGASALVAAPASAQTMTYNLSAQVGELCGVYNSGGSVIDVDFGDLTTTDAGTEIAVPGTQAFYRCNATAGFTRTVTSANSGFMTLNGTATTENARRIRFTMQHGGGSGLGFAAQQVTAPIVTNLGGSTAYLAGQGGTVTFRASGVAAPVPNGAPGTTVFAGNYQDTVTISVVAR